MNLNLFSGFLGPIWGLTVIATNSLEDGEDRLFSCQIVQLCQSILLTCFTFTLFFSSLFRMILIRFSDRGLVMHGRPNLVLFKQLYWTIFGAFFCLGSPIFTLLPLLRGTFEENIQSQICMLLNVEQSRGMTRNLLIQVVFCCMFIIYNSVISYKVNRFKIGICPNGRMGALGFYRRNLITFEDNSKYNFLLFANMLVYSLFLLIIIPRFPNISPRLLFWITHGNTFCLLTLFGLVLPLSMKMPWKSKRQRKMTPFYVHKPNLPLGHRPPPSPPAPTPQATTPPATTPPLAPPTTPPPTVPLPVGMGTQTAMELPTKKETSKTKSNLSQHITITPEQYPE